jgi:hypothetical protein
MKQEKLKDLETWGKNRLAEPSTYRGLAGLLTVFGLVLTPLHFEAILSLGISAISLINILKKDYASADRTLPKDGT